MVIKRTVDGKENSFELTERELCDAFFEQQYNFDKEDIKDYFGQMDYLDGDFEDAFGVSRSKADTLIGEIASEMRRNMDKYDMDWEDARDEAVRSVLAKHK